MTAKESRSAQDDEAAANPIAGARRHEAISVQKGDLCLRVGSFPRLEKKVDLHSRLVVADRRKSRDFDEVRADLLDDAAHVEEVGDEIV